MSASSPAPCSSPPLSASAAARSPNAALAFLVHSPNTLANALPPDVDNKPLARQKRRRTSKEDEDILKAEYAKNPKPDKAARVQLVSRVALGEKEVQIWFQNKRQNDRRRSRPLEPSSSASLMSSSSTMSDPPGEDEIRVREHDGTEDPTEQLPEPDDAEPKRADTPKTPEILPDETATEPRVDIAAEAEATKSDSQTSTDSVTVEPAMVPSTDPQTAETAPTEPSSSQQTQPSSQDSSKAPTSWISNRRSASFMRQGEDYAPEAINFPHPPANNALTPEEPQPATSMRTSIKRKHSFVRISTNENGTARVVTDLDKTPSPPHAHTDPTTFSRAAAGLRRSYSTTGFSDRLAASSRGEPSPKLPKTTSSSVGRSRDSRAWEYWCDADQRNNNSALTARAEKEGSGRAADALGLIRANSRRALAQNQARQNASTAQQRLSTGVKKSRGPMQRASTISGRLQTKDYPRQYSKDKDYGGTETEERSPTDSDKENWEPSSFPGSQPNRRVARPLGPPHNANTRTRQVLGENTEAMSQSTSLGAFLAADRNSKKPSRGTSGENASDPETDEELRLFMGGRTSGSGASASANVRRDLSAVSSAEEAGCVEGLLKLSQGQWR